MVSRRIRWIGVAAIAAVGLGLSACTGSGELRSGVAAQVGDEVISVDWLQERVQMFELLNPGAPPPSDPELAAFQRSNLEEGITVRLQEQLLAREGIEVAEGDVGRVEAQWRQQQEEMIAADPEVEPLPDETLAELARYRVVQEAVVEWLLDGESMTADNQGEVVERYNAVLTEVADEVGVEVNPRYGGWQDEPAFLVEDGLIDPAGGELVQRQS